MTVAQPSALVAELRAAGHTRIADKLDKLDALYASLDVDDGRRPMTDDEHKTQLAHALTTEELRMAQIVEYGTWVAKTPILHNGALAYDAGHPVPVSNVAAHGYDRDGLVTRVRPLPASPPIARPTTEGKATT